MRTEDIALLVLLGICLIAAYFLKLDAKEVLLSIGSSIGGFITKSAYDEIKIKKGDKDGK